MQDDFLSEFSVDDVPSSAALFLACNLAVQGIVRTISIDSAAHGPDCTGGGVRSCGHKAAACSGFTALSIDLGIKYLEGLPVKVG